MVVRYKFPRLVRPLGHFFPIIAIGHSESDAMGYVTVYAYSAWTIRGPKRVWAF